MTGKHPHLWIAASLLAAPLAWSGTVRADDDNLRARDHYGSYGSDQPVSEQERVDREQPLAGMEGDRRVGDVSQGVANEVQREGPAGRAGADDDGEHGSIANASTLREMIGKPLVDRQGARLGKVSAVVRDKQSDQLDAVISSGGFLGIGEERRVVPVDRLALQDDRVGFAASRNGAAGEPQLSEFRADRYEQVALTEETPRG